MSNTKFSESLPEYNKEGILKNKNLEKTKTHPELKDLIGSSVTVFSVFIDPTIPADSATYLHQRITDNIRNTPLYSNSLTDDELNLLLKQNPQLTQAKDVYIDSLATVSVSDKDISNPLGNYLKVDNFLVFQLDQWPCFNCNQDKKIRMKLKLVDAKTGYVVWTGIAENRKISKKESEDIMGLVDELSDQLTEDFFNRFKKKWHRKRYDRLSKNAG
ncbi:hypothetical protein KJ966_11055 [bacterium]|nr:hypothetical protein [bacterium]